MRAILAVASKELKSALVTPVAFIAAASFLLISGFFFFTLLQQFNVFLPQAALLPQLKPSLNEWVATPFFTTISVLLIFLIPILCMGSIAEERKLGTYELLLTSPLTSSQIIWGKFLGTAALSMIFVMVALLFPALLISFSDPEVKPILVGAFGLILLALAYAAICLAVSACTANQTIAALISIVLLTLLSVIDLPAARFEGSISQVLNYASPMQQVAQLFKGIVEAQNLIYFLSLISVGIFIANRALDAERWR